MRRIVSVWLPLWPIERMRRAEPAAVPDDAALALVEAGTHGLRITAVTARAAAEGVQVGQALADARAAFPALMSRPAAPRRDRAALVQLARWCGRYGPARNSDGDDGLWIDTTGVAHFYGGEARLLADLRVRLARLGITARAAVADTLGAAHALARFAPAASVVATPGGTQAELADLPVEALRLAPQTVLLLKRLGLRRIGALCPLPRATLKQRFRSRELAEAVLVRLDQALGIMPEPLKALEEPPALHVQRSWPDPLISATGLEAEAGRLVEELCGRLDARALGSRRIALSLYRTDGTVAEVRAGLSFPSRTPGHLMALLQERLSHVDAGFGVDVMTLAALQVEPLSAHQDALGARLGAAAHANAALLVDRLANRLGAERVQRLVARQSHLPERAEARRPALAGRAGGGSGGASPWPLTAPRPAFLLTPPEPIDVVAEVPEGPPARFTWRRIERRIARAEGPERIAPEWWREIGGKQSQTRDYYRIEDESGATYWVFRDGLYGSGEEPPSWFLHGLFG